MRIDFPCFHNLSLGVRKLGKPFAFVLNQARPRGYRLSEAAAALNAAGVLALPYIVQRNDHQDAHSSGIASDPRAGQQLDNVDDRPGGKRREVIPCRVHVAWSRRYPLEIIEIIGKKFATFAT